MRQEAEERRLITIVFADLSGFTGLSSGLDPEEVKDVASICFEYLNRVIIKQNGTIHKYEGDLVIALFGFPVTHEDDSERAIRASLEMLKLLPEINNALAKKLGEKTDLDLHIGINSGIVFVGEVGSKDKLEYTVMGDVVNLTSRLKDVAQRGEIIVAEPVFRASRYLFDYEACPPVSVKGIKGQLKVFKPLRIKEKPEPKRGIQGLYSPLVGRDEELSRLQNEVNKLLTGTSGIFYILGDAGLGKSRLLEELNKHIVNRNLLINTISGRCLMYGEDTPYFPFLQILQNIFTINDRDPHDNIEKKLRQKAKEIVPDDWQDIVPYVGHLFSVRFDDALDEKIKYLDAWRLKIQIQVSIKKLLAALARTRPLLLVIEDYHWIDSESLELLEFIFTMPESEKHFPILLVCLSRVEKDKGCYGTMERLAKKLGEKYQEIILKPLDLEASTQLVNNLLKICGIRKDLVDQILSKAEGNPFYLEEILRSMIDAGILIYESDSWHLKSEVRSLHIPDTVQAVITARLDKLEKGAREILQAASVMGRNFFARVLENLCDIESMMLTLHLATLEDYEYIRELKAYPELEYIFRHPLTQEVIYNGLLKKKRRELHRRIGEIIEDIYKDRLEDFTDLLAHQYASSDNSLKALEWLKKAGMKAQNNYANDEAIRYFQKIISLVKEKEVDRPGELAAALEALGSVYSLKGEYGAALKNYEEMYQSALGPPGKNRIVQARAKRLMGDIQQKRGFYKETLGLLVEAEKVLTGDSDEEKLIESEIYLMRCWIYRITGEGDRAAAEGQKSVSAIEKLLARNLIDKNLMLRRMGDALSNLGTVFLDRSEYDKAIEYYEKSKKIAEEINNKFDYGRSVSNLAIVYHDMGEYDKAIEITKKYLKLSIDIGDKKGIAASCGNLGMSYHARGENEKAIEHHQNCISIAEEIGDQRCVAAASCNLGNVYKEQGEYEEAIKLYKHSLTIFEEIGEKHGIAAVSGNLGSVYEAYGKFKEAIELHEKSLALFERIKDKKGIGEGTAILANIFKIKGDFDKAAALYQKGLTMAEEIGDKRGIGMRNLSLGELFLLAGDLDQATSYLVKSEKILEEIEEKSGLILVYNRIAELKILEEGLRPVETKQKAGPNKDALKYNDRALKLARESGTKLGEARCYCVDGKIYAAASDFKKAEENFKKAIDIFEALKNKILLADACLEFSQMLKRGIMQGFNFSKRTKEPLGRALEIYKDLKLNHKIKEIERLLAES